MKLATYEAGQGPQLGAIVGEQVVPLTGLASDMLDLISNWDEKRAEAEAMAEAGAGALALADVRLCAPVDRPGKCFAIGLNYADHIEESGMETPKEQVWFTKAVTSIHAPNDPIEIPKISQLVDYEVELVAIVGKGGKHISREDAPAHVFGFCVGNDVTERAWQFRTPQWSLGKSFDTHGPIGPWITTTDEVGDPHALSLRCEVNGEERQSSNTKHLVFDVWAQVEQLSQAMTLEPGDVIFTGTPGGIGAVMDPPQFLKEGDRVRCEIEKLGAIEAAFRNEA